MMLAWLLSLDQELVLRMQLKLIYALSLPLYTFALARRNTLVAIQDLEAIGTIGIRNYARWSEAAGGYFYPYDDLTIRPLGISSVHCKRHESITP